jgi:2-C-methyl-D-erythritol 4-phosphate cytidylyltransferase/2-C-methyl-D-erythritol 2,4-cyclodiphosphate synthase
MLSTCADLARADGYSIANIDVTIIAQDVLVGPHRDTMRLRVADAASMPVERVSVKATTTDRLGWIGRSEGLAAHAVVTINR